MKTLDKHAQPPTCNECLQVPHIPRAENAGKYLAETNDGRLLYLNHANQWQEMPNILRAVVKECLTTALPSPTPEG